MKAMQNIIAAAIMQLLQNNGVTFAQVVFTTQVILAAAHAKNNVAYKTTSANVQLFGNINAFTKIYTNAVKRSAARVGISDAANIDAFIAKETYYVHDKNCYSIVRHRTNDNMYLYCIVNNASSVYYLNNVISDKQTIAQLCTKSVATKLLNNSVNIIHNVSNNVEHDVSVRVIALTNIRSITANKQTITF